MCIYVYAYVCVCGGSSIFLTSSNFPDNVCVHRVCVYVYVCMCGRGGLYSIFLTSRKFPDNVCVHSVCVCICVGGV